MNVKQERVQRFFFLLEFSLPHNTQLFLFWCRSALTEAGSAFGLSKPLPGKRGTVQVGCKAVATTVAKSQSCCRHCCSWRGIRHVPHSEFWQERCRNLGWEHTSSKWEQHLRGDLESGDTVLTQDTKGVLWEYRRRRIGVGRWDSKGVQLIPLSGRWDKPYERWGHGLWHADVARRAPRADRFCWRRSTSWAVS